jgi:ABC-type transport system involved in multi-copper enzyme maturation permease subunit
MLSLLIVKEIRAHVLSFRFALAFALLLVLIVCSVEIIALGYDRQVNSYAEAARAQKEKMAEAADFRQMRYSGIEVDRRPNPLSVFAVGLEKEMSRSISISQMREARLGRSKYPNPLYVLFPAPDLLYIVNIVGSLLAVLFAFDAICGEQEGGTLRLLLAQSLPGHTLLLAKWIGGYIALIIPSVTALLCALLVAQNTTALSLTAAQWGILGGMLVIAALYISLFFGLGLFISTLVQNTSTSLVINFLVWVLLVLMVPNTAPIVARALVPVPSPGVMAGQREAIQRDLWNSQRRNFRRSSSREERQQKFDEAQEKIREETDKFLVVYMQKVDRQIGLGIALARISPSASYVYATTGLAGTGLRGFGDLREYISRYRQEFMAKIEDVSNARRRLAGMAADAEERQEIMQAPLAARELPAFAPPLPSLSEALVEVRTDLLILIALNVVFFLGAHIAFMRYDLMG